MRPETRGGDEETYVVLLVSPHPTPASGVPALGLKEREKTLPSEDEYLGEPLLLHAL